MDDGNLVSLDVASQWFPLRRGKRLSTKAIRRRIHKGIRGIRLDAVRDGGEWFTCRKWVEEFHEALTESCLRPIRVEHSAFGKTPDRVKRRLARRYGINVG